MFFFLFFFYYWFIERKTKSSFKRNADLYENLTAHEDVAVRVRLFDFTLINHNLMGEILSVSVLRRLRRLSFENG